MRWYAIFLIASLSAWGQTAPRGEVPNPQFQRPQWLTLNGAWDFEFDDGARGLEENWADGAHKFTRRITVPYAFETKLSGIGETGFHPVAWYRRSFTVPAEWKGKNVLLCFGAVDYDSTVWVNGRFAGGHEGGGTPFKLDVTPLLKPGTNTVTVRAFDPPTDRSIPRGKQFWEPKSRGIFYTRTSGIWQPAWIEAAGASRIDFFRVDARLDGKVTFEARLANAKPNLALEAEIRQDGKTVARTESIGVVEGKYIHAGAAILNPRLWSVERPALYDVTLRLKDGETVLDTVESYFGFREITLEHGRVCINHRPVYLKFLLDQGYWPDSLLTPPTDEAIQYDIRMAKEMGFNGVRKHQKVEDPRYHYWADKMGFLISGEIANAYLYDEQYVQRFTREWMEAVLRDINHPSVILWNPINESWGVPNLRDPRQEAHLRSLYELTKSLDPTRLVIDNEGWEHTELTDLYAVHDYSPSYERLKERWGGVQAGQAGAALPNNGRPYEIPGIPYNGAPLYLSEFGGIAFIPPGTSVPESAWGYSGVEKTAESALARLTGLYRAIKESPFVGICYTQITDVEQEINGLMTYDRKPKYDVKQIKALNDSLR
jgi:beta-galactosidase/beta-glucuronidase